MGEEINLKKLFRTYSKHWKWFVLCSLFTTSLAIYYVRYATPQYLATAKIRILDQSAGSGLEVFRDLDVFSMGKNNVLDEIELIKSRSNFIEVVRKLRLNVQMRELGNIKSSEIYKKTPVFINFIADDSIINKAEYTFYLFIKSKTSLGIGEFEDNPDEIYDYGTNIPTPLGDIVITPNNPIIGNYSGKVIKVIITPLDLVASYFRQVIDVTNEDETSNIVNISLKDEVPLKATNIINELINVYNTNGIEDKKEIANQTAAFINDRISEISLNLSSVDDSAESLRVSRGITDIASETNINLQTGAANRQELSRIENELNIASSMKDILDQQESFEVLPGNLGLSDPTIASTTLKFNQLVQERNRLLKSSNTKNPVIINLDEQLGSLKRSIEASLNGNVNNLALTLNTLSGQQSIINSRIYSAPLKERALRDITRKQQTTESLYLYLLQKREEIQIAAISSKPQSKIVDMAYQVSRTPVAPRRMRIMLAAILVGLFIPFSLIYIRDLLDNKIQNMDGLQEIAQNIPILGEIPKIGKKQSKKITKNDRSILAESLRITRTNLDYLLKTSKNTKNKKNIIFITSSVSGEGKTFVSSNLAMIFANTNKKVLLLGADIRNPKIYNFFNDRNIDKIPSGSGKMNIGLTEYLYDQTITVKEITNSMLVDSNEIDVIYSGRIPPNPAELLMSDRLSELFDTVSELYDYVVVDTAPLMVVTDTLLIAKYADNIIYVTKAGVTDKKAIEYPIGLQKEGKISGLAFIVNNVLESNLGYGGNYGYGYGKVDKKWWSLK